MLWFTNLVWWISEKPHQDVVVEPISTFKTALPIVNGQLEEARLVLCVMMLNHYILEPMHTKTVCFFRELL